MPFLCTCYSSHHLKCEGFEPCREMHLFFLVNVHGLIMVHVRDILSRQLAFDSMYLPIIWLKTQWKLWRVREESPGSYGWRPVEGHKRCNLLLSLFGAHLQYHTVFIFFLLVFFYIIVLFLINSLVMVPWQMLHLENWEVLTVYLLLTKYLKYVLSLPNHLEE